jgi:hypothetical protein
MAKFKGKKIASPKFGYRTNSKVENRLKQLESFAVFLVLFELNCCLAKSTLALKEKEKTYTIQHV